MNPDLSSDDYENTMLLVSSRDSLLEDALMHVQMPKFNHKKKLRVSMGKFFN